MSFRKFLALKFFAAPALRLLACGALALLAAGCVSPERLADHLVTAPNRQRQFVSDKEVNSLYHSILGKQDPFLRQTIPVGPPEATLAVMELPAADYHLKVTSKVVRDKKGGTNFVLMVNADTNAVTTPLESKGTIVLLHGYITQKETMLPWAFVLAQAGWRVVLVDLRGHGHSTGHNFYAGKYEATDMVQMLDYLVAHNLCDAQVGVLGYSFGADLALYWAVRDPRVRTVVAIAAYNQPAEAIPRFAKDMQLPFSQEKVRQAATIAEAKLGIHWSDLSGENAVKQIKVPLFFIGGQKDIISPPEDQMLFKKLAPSGSQTLLIPEANHEVVGYWMHGLATPVTAWFEEKRSLN